MMQEFTAQVKRVIEDKIHEMHTIIPGKVISFTPDLCEADVLPYGKWRLPDGKMLDYPLISGVPVFFPQGAGQTATIVYPVKPDDECLLLCGEQTLDVWRTHAQSDTDLRFDLQNAIAIVGLFSRPNPLVREAIEKDALIIDCGGSRITLLPDGKLEVDGNVTIHGNLSVDGSITYRQYRGWFP
jgi:hypothetical protein